ncbi:D-2-hydroxyacid dehydrogenase [Pigmentiphaga sp. GD03639]|jgi:glycerate dehydrogenase|uniref:D-2-hydroxyacid dehydrogenase n=1 Tax=Pigmentiphaga daeguensis TaxID=414049 RepID=A0ABN1CT51_9BURK|nr:MULTISPECIES: D-2-hydroxyacid dehydrogenase [unclassified Pigmentiphaga]MDH2239002.1 D-2-hydroxyacid dehydrogenase [Pigmentiphaga sp. GD03639]OVZ63253.1 glycerate dehydrogenase [Pigmentiphaga sp. NML030171]
MSSFTHKIVFLDRASLQATIRPPAFSHAWVDHEITSRDEVVARLKDASIAVTNKVPLRRAELDQLPALKMIAVAATGTDIIDLAACQERGIVVSNIRNYATASLPEHTFALILALRRNLRAYAADVEAGKWQRSQQFCFLDYPIRDLSGSRLGIVGYGALGRSVAALGRAFGMEICVASRSPVDEPGIVNLPLPELLRTSDVVTLHLPLSAATRNMIGRAELASMKPTALLINTARGGLVDEAALAEALRAGTIAGAGFDVADGEPPADANPLLHVRQPNFILTPHVAWASQEAMQTLADQLVDNLEAFVAGKPRNVVLPK